MTIGNLWLPSLGPTTVPAPVVRGSVWSHTNSNTWSPPLPVTTNAGDCIIVAVGAVDLGGAIVASGAGATWVQATLDYSGYWWGFLVGYNCSAGQTSYSLSSEPGWDVLTTVWSGVLKTSNPILASNTGTSTTGHPTTGSVSYSPGQLVLGTTGNHGGHTMTATWSNGMTNTNVITGNLGATTMLTMDEITPASSGSTTYSVTSTGGADQMGAVVAVFSPG